MHAAIFLFALIQLAITTQCMPSDTSGATNKSTIRERAVVVGGGPVGLASAIMLAHEGYDVSVLEAIPLTEKENPALAYTYSINSRGQSFTKMFPNIHKKLVKTTLPVCQAGLLIVPANNTTPIINPKLGFRKNSKAYFIARNELILLLRDAVDEHNNERDPNGEVGKIDFEPGMKCIDINPSTSDEDRITVLFKDTKTGEEKGIAGKLIVGADGIKSKVRECLKENPVLIRSWGYRAKNFRVKKWISPSSGLKLKTLQMSTGTYSIIVSDGSKVATVNTDFVMVRGKNINPLQSLSLSSFPVKNTSKVRQAIFVTTPKHFLWTMNTGFGVKSWFKDNFEQRVDFNGVVSDKEWDRFAKSKGLIFPPCQYSRCLQASAKNGECGIVLLGDAAHAFGPDIGQGVNSGLADVVQLQKSLLGTHGKKNYGGRSRTLGGALKDYEHIQAAETRALVHLVRFAKPYQYNRPELKYRIGKNLWSANMIVRGFLKKISFGLFPGQIMHILINEKLSYRQIARRADSGTAVLMTMVALALGKLFA